MGIFRIEKESDADFQNRIASEKEEARRVYCEALYDDNSPILRPMVRYFDTMLGIKKPEKHIVFFGKVFKIN